MAIVCYDTMVVQVEGRLIDHASLLILLRICVLRDAYMRKRCKILAEQMLRNRTYYSLKSFMLDICRYLEAVR
jgi:hypothetical protein